MYSPGYGILNHSIGLIILEILHTIQGFFITTVYIARRIVLDTQTHNQSGWYEATNYHDLCLFLC